MGNKIRLVIFDMGFTLWDEIPDIRAVFQPEGDGHGDEFYKIDEDHMYRYEGISNRIFPGVRKLFQILRNRNILVSINSLNRPEAWRWIEKEYYKLNSGGFIKYSKIGEYYRIVNGVQTKEDAHRSDIKGLWTQEIIDAWNLNECKEIKIQNHEVLFIDDNIHNHKAVQKICPGVHCVYPTTYGKKGMLRVVDIIAEIETECLHNE